MLAKENPDSIQVSRSGSEVLSEKQEKVLTLVDAWDTMRGSSKEDFLKKNIPEGIRKALKEKEELKRKIHKNLPQNLL